jgi:[ribosomal protein S5]-alanine N-acetyltransferase
MLTAAFGSRFHEAMMSQRVFIRMPIEADWRELRSMNERSRVLHHPWVLPPLSEEECRAYIARCNQADFAGFCICNSINGQIVGIANLSQIFYKAFQSCYLGYYAHAAYAGQGLMKEGLRLVVAHAFTALNLHRIEANIQPENQASIALVRHLGFSKEGFSRRYLFINGAWQDHERWAITIEDWPMP